MRKSWWCRIKNTGLLPNFRLEFPFPGFPSFRSAKVLSRSLAERSAAAR